MSSLCCRRRPFAPDTRNVAESWGHVPPRSMKQRFCAVMDPLTMLIDAHDAVRHLQVR